MHGEAWMPGQPLLKDWMPVRGVMVSAKLGSRVGIPPAPSCDLDSTHTQFLRNVDRLLAFSRRQHSPRALRRPDTRALRPN